jgi:uncharacterized protein (DUF58 family)
MPTTAMPSALLSLDDIAAIELPILRRINEITGGDHHSRTHGSGFDIVGLRDWQAGDRFNAIDWAQSSLNNFAPMVVREFEQPSIAPVIAIADGSASTRCGIDGASIAATIARAIAIVGLSASFFQDPFGLIVFDDGLQNFSALRARSGKHHVIHCVDAYQYRQNLQAEPRHGGFGATLSGYLQRTTLLPFVSDFLFDNIAEVLRELAYLNARHDVFIVLVDSDFAFELPAISADWVTVADVETGRAQTISRRTLQRMAEQIRRRQDQVAKDARALGLDVIVMGQDLARTDIALSEFVAERRLRKPRD